MTNAETPNPADHTADHTEVEWQFDALDVRPVIRWLEGSSFGASVTPSGEKELTDSYLDTEDWRVHRAGFALRIREKGGESGATMKVISASKDFKDPENPENSEGLKERREISESLDSPDSELPKPDKSGESGKSVGVVGERVRSLAGRKTLRTLFEVRTKRRTYKVEVSPTLNLLDPLEDETSVGEVSVGEVSVGEVALDESEIRLTDGAPAVLRRVEVELKRGSLEGLGPFVEELRRGCRLTPSQTSKFEAGLLASEFSPPAPPEFGPTETTSEGSVGEFAYAVMRGQFQKFLAHESGTRIGEDPEELHDMRVASRRLRAAMQIFKDALPVRSRKSRDELKWIAGILGEVRDLDVQLESLETWISAADPEDRAPLSELRGVLGERREKARKKMLRSLDSRRFTRFVEVFSSFLRRGPSRRSPEAGRPVLEVGPALIRRRYRKVRRAGDWITKESSAGEYHELRKRCKRLRYALEFFAGVYGKPASKLVKPLKSLQDVLGDHQDAEVAVARLRELALPAERPEKRRGESVSLQAVFAMGGVANRYQTAIAGLRGEFPEAYAKIRGKRWRRLKGTMEALRRDEDETGMEN